MKTFLMIGLAGAIGTWTRYLVGVWAGRALGDGFPYGTLFVNLVGCFVLTLVAQIAFATTHVTPAWRLTLMTGFCGGLTTYSSFNYDTTRLLQNDAIGAAIANVAVTLVGCFAAGLLGLFVARRAFP